MTKGEKVGIVIPSYNESKSIEVLLTNIFKVLPNVKVVVVDDSSKIENEKIKKTVIKYKSATIISRHEKQGRGTAILVGFESLLKRDVNYIFEMDSDLAHDPYEFDRFFKKIKEKNFDLIIGSRYLLGGRIKNIEKKRIILSRIVNFFLRVWLGVNVSDFTSGFRLYSKRAVTYLIKQKIESTGFISLTEILLKIQEKGYQVSEVPITWNNRKFGKSNLNIKELLVSLYLVLKMGIAYKLNNLKFW